MSDAKKITMHLEGTDGIQNDTATDYFISGPLLIFAEVDTLTDLYGDELKEIIIESDFYKSRQSIIVFVKQVFNEEDLNEEPDLDPIDTLKYRGSYFMYDYSREEIFQNNEPAFYGDPITYVNTAWEEILVGTHTHDNKQLLDKLSKIDAEDNSGFIEVIKTADGYDFNIRHLEKQLPSLPKYIENVIKDNAALNEYPVDSEFNHLDGTALYKIDEATVCAQCSDLYEYVRTLGRKLYVTRKDGRLILTETRAEISAKIDAYDISSDNHSEDFQEKPTYIFTGNTSFKNLNTLIFIDTDVVSPLEYNARISDEHENVLAVIFDQEIESGKTITLITLEDNQNITVKNVYDAISENILSLSSIKTKIFEIYINASLQNKKEVPKVYLTNDDNGNLVWENRLLPTQSFYCQHKYLYSSNYVIENEYLNIIFDNVYFDYKYDFPLIMIDQLFAFDAEYFTVGDKQQHLKLRIPDSYFKGDNSERITLVVIKNTMGNAISQEMLRNYVTKEDAISILSHGSIKLDNFVKYADLDNYAFKAHTHSNFALVGHTHDYRYADYHHTHAQYVTSYQLLEVINKLNLGVNLTENDIGEITESLITRISTLIAEQGFMKLSQVDAIFTDAGFKQFNSGEQFYLSSDSVFLNKDTISLKLLEKLLYDGENAENLAILNLTDTIERLLNAFDRDTVEDEQVLLTDDIVVYNPVGGIKEFDENGYRTVIKKGTDYHTILNDMLNPYMSKDHIEDILVPVRAEFKFYYDEDCLNEICPESIDFSEFIVPVYAKFIRYINKFGEDCLYTYSIHNNAHTVKTDIDPNVDAVVEIRIIVGDDTDVNDDGENDTSVSNVHRYEVSRLPDRDDVVYKFELNPNLETLSQVEIITKTKPIFNIFDNRDNEVISEFLPMDINSGEYFFKFEKCLAEYTIIDGNDVITKEFNTDILITIPANDQMIRTIIIAYQKQLENKLRILYGLTNITSSFVPYEPESWSIEVNPEEYNFIKYEILPLDSELDISVYLDKSNIITKPIYSTGSNNSCGENCSGIDSTELSQIFNKLEIIEDFMKSGIIKIIDFTIQDTDEYIVGRNIIPRGYLVTNKLVDLEQNRIRIALNYGENNSNSTSNFKITRDISQDIIVHIDSLNKNIGYGYSFVLDNSAIPLTDNSTITAFVTDGYSNDTSYEELKFRPRIMHAIYTPNSPDIDLSTENIYAGTYNYDFYIQTENAGPGSYIILAIPGDVLTENVEVKFEVNSFEGGFEELKNGQIPANLNRYVEDGWKIYKSVNHNLGQILVHVYTIGADQKDDTTSYFFGQKIN